MIFGLLVLVWLYDATKTWMVLPPMIFLILREFYLDRKLKLNLIWIPIVSSLLAYLFMVRISKIGVDIASLRAGKILVSGVILIQLAYGILENGPSYAGQKLGTLLLYTERCLILEKRIMINARYSYKVRRRYNKIWSREVWKLIQGLVLTATSEFLRLAEDMLHLYKSRGSNPVTKGWVVPQARRIPITYGDLIILVLIGVILYFGLERLIPNIIKEIYFM